MFLLSNSKYLLTSINRVSFILSTTLIKLLEELLIIYKVSARLLYILYFIISLLFNEVVLIFFI